MNGKESKSRADGEKNIGKKWKIQWTKNIERELERQSMWLMKNQCAHGRTIIQFPLTKNHQEKAEKIDEKKKQNKRTAAAPGIESTKNIIQ